MFLDTPMRTAGAHAASTGRLEQVLSVSKAFGGLDRGLLSELAARTEVQRFGRGEKVWRAGDIASHFTILQSGIVKVMRSSSDGRDTIVGILGPRESVDDVSVFEGGRSPEEAVAVTPSVEVLRIEAQPVLNLAKTDIRVASVFIKTLRDHTQTLTEKIIVMSAGSVDRRIATLFAFLYERFGDEMDDGRLTIPVPLSRLELSSFVGARVETVIRTVRGWERAGVLQTTPEGFIIRSMEHLNDNAKSSAEAESVGSSFEA